MLVPAVEPLPGDDRQDLRDFYRYHACLTEPWDGPAGLVFTDGHLVGAALDRNGLRPMRWEATEDGLVVCSSEAGAVDTAGRGRVQRGRLGPGQMLCVDPERGLILLKGGVPGPKGGWLRVTDAVKSALPLQAPFPAAVVHKGEALEAIAVDEGEA